MILASAALVATSEREPGVGDVVGRLVAHVESGGDLRTPPAEWRPTYPMDDPANAPDLWIADKTGEVIWCKLDTHPPQGTGAACGWCGRTHREPMAVYTFMLPSDY